MRVFQRVIDEGGFAAAGHRVNAGSTLQFPVAVTYVSLACP